jgi:plastocyanin
MATHTVTIKGMKYNPARLPIKAGDSVVWKNDDGATHTATADNGPVPDTGDIDGGETSSPQKFDAPGSYKYHCEYHGNMKGEVVAS